MSVGDDFHGSEQAAEYVHLLPRAQEAVVRAALQCQKEMPDLLKRLRARTTLLKRCLDFQQAADEGWKPKTDCKCVWCGVAAELAKDREPTP